MSHKLLFCAFEGTEKPRRIDPGPMRDVRKGKQSEFRLGRLEELEQSAVEATAQVDQTSRGGSVIEFFFVKGTTFRHGYTHVRVLKPSFFPFALIQPASRYKSSLVAGGPAYGTGLPIRNQPHSTMSCVTNESSSTVICGCALPGHGLRLLALTSDRRRPARGQ